MDHTFCVDANPFHDLITGRAVTGIIHLQRNTDRLAYTKRQPTVEAVTYAAEVVDVRTAVDQIIDLPISLRYSGVRLLDLATCLVTTNLW